MKVIQALFVLLACLAAAACFFVPAFLVPEQRSEQTLSKILFVGDMMFDRTMRTFAEQKGYGSLFSCLDSYLADFDLVVGNLEGPITSASSTSVGTRPGIPGNTAFTFSPYVATELSKHNVLVVNLGNNHILDRGRDGMESTHRALENNGIVYFGAPGYGVATTTHVSGREVGFVNFNQFLGQNDPAKTMQAIRNLKSQGIFVTVYAHWGDEYVPETDAVKALAHSFIDAGADLVIGSHPHVIQAIESYRGKQIYYSLGNFIFDQYFNSAVTQGMGVEVTLVDTTATLKERLFTISRDGTTCPVPESL